MSPAAKAKETPQADQPKATVSKATPPKPISASNSIIEVMRAVGAVSKSGHNKAQDYNFRGIDAVINAVGPELRKVGGFITPNVLNIDYEHGVTNKGNSTREAALLIRYDWHGSDGGEPVSATIVSEATDTSDKATAKAMSVAYRTYLIQILCLPTDDPDPDEDFIERGKVQEQARPPAPQQTEQHRTNTIMAQIAGHYSGLTRTEIGEAVELDSGRPLSEHTFETYEAFLAALNRGEVKPTRKAPEPVTEPEPKPKPEPKQVVDPASGEVVDEAPMALEGETEF